MGILDGIVEWFAEQVMKFLDLINSSVLGALGCNMSTFKRYFPAVETMYKVFVALGIGLILLNLVWQLFKNFGAPLGSEAEDPLKLTLRSAVFILLVYFADEIVDLILKIGGTPAQTLITPRRLRKNTDYGGSAICATYDLNNFFALEGGKYEKDIINNCKTIPPTSLYISLSVCLISITCGF